MHWQERVIDIIENEPHEKISWFYSANQFDTSEFVQFMKLLCTNQNALYFKNTAPTQIKKSIGSKKKNGLIVFLHCNDPQYVDNETLKEVKEGLFCSNGKTVLYDSAHVVIFSSFIPSHTDFHNEKYHHVLCVN